MPRPEDWAGWVHGTGFFFLDDEEEGDESEREALALARPALLQSRANCHAPSQTRMSHSACWTVIANSHCRATSAAPTATSSA